MGRLAGLLVVLLAGCDTLWGLGHIDLHADASVDAPVDAAIDASCMPRALSPLAVSEDTMLLDESNANPANRHGGDDTIDLALNGTSRLLLRFMLTSEMTAALTPSGTAVEATLTLTIRTSGGGCGAGCTTKATSFQVFAANNYWNEGSPSASYFGAAWHNRYQTTSTDGLAWMVDGADGTTDRSYTALGSGSVQDGASGTVTVTLSLVGQARSEIASRLAAGTNAMSLIVVPTSGGTMFVYSREGGLASAARFTMTVCP